MQLLVYSSMGTGRGTGMGVGTGMGMGMEGMGMGMGKGMGMRGHAIRPVMVCALWSVHSLRPMVCARSVAGAARWEAQQRGAL